ncbi:MAG: MerR family transcriptional regulator [Chryseobacterium sp.]|nr:MerR family transcriptional regulator [Chryseobacterium sp.]
MTERISREELVRIYNVEITFFDALQESGLLKTQTENDMMYVSYDELHVFERLSNLYYDLEVNLPGLEIIHYLHAKMEVLKNENSKLRRQKPW